MGSRPPKFYKVKLRRVDPVTTDLVRVRLSKTYWKAIRRPLLVEIKINLNDKRVKV